MDKDLEHLKTLSIFHYVAGGVVGLFSCIPFIHVIVGIAFVVAPDRLDGPQAPPPLFGWMFIVMGSLFILGGWALATVLLIAGRCLARQRHYYFCMTAAGLSCLFMPVGTVLGVFTILVLARPTVKPLFERGGLPAGPPDGGL